MQMLACFSVVRSPSVAALQHASQSLRLARLLLFLAALPLLLSSLHARHATPLLLVQHLLSLAHHVQRQPQHVHHAKRLLLLHAQHVTQPLHHLALAALLLRQQAALAAARLPLSLAVHHAAVASKSFLAASA